jgi:hypothetical protein
MILIMATQARDMLRAFKLVREWLENMLGTRRTTRTCATFTNFPPLDLDAIILCSKSDITVGLLFIESSQKSDSRSDHTTL